jgi:hypothetical protein
MAQHKVLVLLQLNSHAKMAPDSRGHAKRGGLQPLQILDKGCERGSRLDREPTGTIAPAGLT